VRHRRNNFKKGENVTLTTQEAAGYIRWCGVGDNRSRSDQKKFERSVEAVRKAAVLITVNEGYKGSMDVVAVVGQEVAYRDHRDDCGWGCHFCYYEVGDGDSPSQYVRGEFFGGVLVLAPEDAEKIGIEMLVCA
jgi:hypothetical protein